MFGTWLRDYFSAWISNDPDDVAALFTEDARYWVNPFVEPWRGRDEIVRRWTSSKPEEIEWDVEVLSFVNDVGVAHWNVKEDGSREMDGILMITFAPDGRCREHREWFATRERQA